MTLPFCLSVFVENFFIGSWTSPKLGFFADFLDTDITNLTGMQLWAGGGGGDGRVEGRAASRLRINEPKETVRA